MKKWNILVTGNDGRDFYQHFHVIEKTPDMAVAYLLENFPYPALRKTVKVDQIEEFEDAEWFLPGIVYKSGRAYFKA